MYDGLPIFDADGHVIEPTTLWWDFIDPDFRSALEPDAARLGETYGRLMPRVEGRPTFQGSAMMTEYLRSDSVDDMQRERFGSIAEQGFSPAGLIDAIDAEGIDLAAVYPSFGLHVPYCRDLSPPLAVALARAYNRWIGEYAREAGPRVVPIGLAPLHDPAGIEAEIRRSVREDGVRGFMIRPNPIGGRPLHHPGNERVFAALQELDVAAIIHEGRGANVTYTGEDRFDTWYASRAASHPMEAMMAFAGLAVDGYFDRLPRLRVAFLESGTGWLPYWLDRLDEHHEMWAAGERPDLQHPPSVYFERQCAISGETDDRFVGDVVRFAGAQRVMWASDFPHMECHWPDSLRLFMEKTELDRDALRSVLWETPCRIYGLDPAELPKTAEGS